jgi:DNA-binding NarL/FixJ family response regulator
MIRVIVADDHRIFRQGLLRLLQSSNIITVVGEAGDGKEALNLITTEAPEIAILDISMPGLSGFEVIRQLEQQENNTKIIYLTMHDDLFTAKKVITSKAKGFVSKDDAYEDLIYAIEAVSSGRRFVSPSISDKIFSLNILKDSDDDVLTKRELEILKLIAEGVTNKKIAGQLSISVKTVETYRSRIMQKLDLHSTADLIKYAIRNGLLK